MTKTMPLVEWVDAEVTLTSVTVLPTITAQPAVVDVDPAPLAVAATAHVWSDPAEVEICQDDMVPAFIFEATKDDLVPELTTV